MPLFHVTYDLTQPENSEDYVDLRDAIKKAGGVKTQLSAWLIPSASDGDVIYSYLKNHIDKNDKLMVIEITKRPLWHSGFKGTKALIDEYFPV